MVSESNHLFMNSYVTAVIYIGQSILYIYAHANWFIPNKLGTSNALMGHQINGYKVYKHQMLRV
jgi:hypothetical protein